MKLLIPDPDQGVSGAQTGRSASEAHCMMNCPACSSSRGRFFTSAFDRVLNRPEQMWKIHRCSDCGFGWTEPALRDEEIKQHYPLTYLGDTERTLDEFLSGRLQQSRSWKKEVEKVNLVQDLVPSGRILDVGCGDGKFLWALDSRKWDRTGVEFSEETVRLVNQRIDDLKLIEGDIFSEKLQEGSFDVVTFWHVLEHLPRPQEVLERVRRLLSPGGWIIISLPNLNSLQARLFRRYWYAFDDVPRHLYHFAPRPLEKLLHEKGFHELEHRFFSPIVNIHCLKYSLINWSVASCGSRLPYYLLKPLLMLFPFLERITGRYGMLTTVARQSE
ncbi:MAG: class I SAM-dependent methyltransferase [Acidobacteriota bacterium]